MTNWLQNLKAGDKVIVSNRYGRQVRLVDRTTATRIVVDGAPYSKQHGGSIGTDRFFVGSIREWSPEKQQLMETEDAEKNARDAAKKALDAATVGCYRRLTTSQLTRMAAIAGEGKD